jgi:hypothetical protein
MNVTSLTGLESGISHEFHIASALYKKGEMVPRLGLESSESPNKDRENLAPTHLGTHQDSDLVKIITAWSHLPFPLKAAILVIVNSSATSQEDAK